MEPKPKRRRGGAAKRFRRLLRNLCDLVDPEGKKQRQESIKKLESMQRCAEKEKSVHSKREELKSKYLEKLKKEKKARVKKEKKAREEAKKAREEAERIRAEELRNRLALKAGFKVANIALRLFFPVVPLTPDCFPDIDPSDLDLPDLDLPDLDLPDLDLPDLDLPDLDLPDFGSFSLEDFFEIPEISEFLPDGVDFEDLLDGIEDVLDTTDLDDMVDGLNLDFVNLNELTAVEGQLDTTLERLDEMLASY